MTRLFILCSGLGHTLRGFERFSVECAEALRGADDLSVRLLHAHEARPNSLTARITVTRDSGAARCLARLFGRTPYDIEQFSYAFAALPALAAAPGAVALFSDGALGNALWRARSLLRLNFRLLLSNGAPFRERVPACDHIQQLTPEECEYAASQGIPAAAQTVLPYGVAIPAQFTPCGIDERRALRTSLRLPAERAIVISVGAINSSHKRMDYLIREVAALNEQRPFLLLLGERGEESAAVEELARGSLRPDDYAIRRVPHEQITDYYRASDIFALASLREGFGRVYVEALASGLPCIAHDNAVTRFIFDGLGTLTDLTVTGALTAALHGAAAFGLQQESAIERHHSVYQRFDWHVLAPRYRALVQRVAQEPARCARWCDGAAISAGAR